MGQPGRHRPTLAAVRLVPPASGTPEGTSSDASLRGVAVIGCSWSGSEGLVDGSEVALDAQPAATDGLAGHAELGAEGDERRVLGVVRVASFSMAANLPPGLTAVHNWR